MIHRHGKSAVEARMVQIMRYEAMKCLNVIVYYDNKEEIKQYITKTSLIADGMVDFAIVVNKDTNGQADELNHELSVSANAHYEFMDFGKNVGYLNAMLETLRAMNWEGYDYVILSNTDIDYEMKDFFPELSHREYSSEIGVVAPSVYSSSNRYYQNPHYRDRISKGHFKRLYFLFKYPAFGRFYLKLAEIKGKSKPSVKQESCYVYSPNGSYMIFTKRFVSLIKDYYYKALLYSEESCVGELLLKYGLKCFYDNSLEVIHHESTVTGKINYKKRFALWRESIGVILEEFYGW